MIFVTVGTQLPFDRLISAIDAWAGADKDREVFAQIGPSRLRPRNIQSAEFVSPHECTARMLAASVVVAHAGMGTILTALEMGKPLLVMPRRAALGEHRNDHQLATARRFADGRSVAMALDESDLTERLAAMDGAGPVEQISRAAPDDFVAGLRAFIIGDELQAAVAPAASSPGDASTPSLTPSAPTLAGRCRAHGS